MDIVQTVDKSTSVYELCSDSSLHIQTRIEEPMLLPEIILRPFFACQISTTTVSMQCRNAHINTILPLLEFYIVWFTVPFPKFMDKLR